MTPWEEKVLREMGDYITRPSKDWLKSDKAETNMVYLFYHELYRAAYAHPDWPCDEGRACCADYYSPQNTPKKLLIWYRAKHGTPTRIFEDET